MKKWIDFSNGSTIGEKGSENGIILKDQEFDGGCRITLESCTKYQAITCGVYGVMVHTVFCSPEDAETTFEAMKKELGEFMMTETDADAEMKFYAQFCDKYI